LAETNTDVARLVVIEPDPGAKGEGVVIDGRLVEAGVGIHESKKGLGEGRESGAVKE
jgi:hypothetical protein